MKVSRFINEADADIVEALERLFIHEPPKTDDPEDEFDYRFLRQLFVVFASMTVIRLTFNFIGTDEDFYYPKMYSLVATFFFTWLFVMIHFETKNPSRIMLVLTWASCCFSLW